MTWKDRVRPFIELVSPRGVRFQANWFGNDTSRDKNVALFNYPGINGTKTQDLGLPSGSYPLNFEFEGPDHDLIARNFESQMVFPGPWTVIHPIEGEISLQPISFSVGNQPVRSSNTTRIESEWIEFFEEGQFQSAQELAGEIEDISSEISVAAAESFSNGINQGLPEDSLIASSESLSSIGKATSRLRGLSRRVSNVSSEFESVIRGLRKTLEEPVVDAISLAGGIRNLLELPALATNDAFSRYESYSSLIDDIFGDIIPDNTEETIVKTSVAEFFSTTTIQAMANVAITSEFESRGEIISAIEKQNKIFTSIVNSLDLIQEAFVDNSVDRKYFSQTKTFAQLSLINALSLKYMLDQTFDVAIEKRITLDRPRAPIEITASEYGDLGDNDQNFDIFIKSNALTPAEFHVLPVGREIVVYVEPEGVT